MSIPFVIHFIKHESKKENDDILTITKTADGFLWEFQDANVRLPHVVTYKCWSVVTSRLYTLMKAVAADHDPVKNVQVDTPAFPCILFSHNSLTPKVIETIADCFAGAATNWPERDQMPPLVPHTPSVTEDEGYTPYRAGNTRPRHTFYE
jgi:hypothetical protein